MAVAVRGRHHDSSRGGPKGTLPIAFGNSRGNIGSRLRCTRRSFKCAGDDRTRNGGSCQFASELERREKKVRVYAVVAVGSDAT